MLKTTNVQGDGGLQIGYLHPKNGSQGNLGKLQCNDNHIHICQIC